MIVPQEFTCHINVAYPQSNLLTFEEWLTQQTLPELEREFIPIHTTAYHVNNGYGQNGECIRKLQEFFDGLDRSKKYFCVWQYDDGLLIDTKDLDIVTFGMSYRLQEQKPTHIIPLIGQMPPSINAEKKYIASFIGSITHPIREKLVQALKGKEHYYISTESHSADEYHTIMAQSVFTLCPVGYGKTSFRQYESIHQNSIPIVIYEDEVMEPYGINTDKYGIKVHDSGIELIPTIVESISDMALELKRKKMKQLYPILCTYDGVLGEIIKTLQNEN